MRNGPEKREVTAKDHESMLQLLDLCAGREGHDGLTMIHFDAHDDLQIEAP